VSEISATAAVTGEKLPTGAASLGAHVALFRASGRVTAVTKNSKIGATTLFLSI